jgi:hypothetical protein
MECLMSGNTQVSLSDFDDCDQNATSNSISQKCCDFGSITLDFDFETNTNSKDLNITTPTFGLYPLTRIIANKITPQNDFNFYTNLPPPSGYELLKVVQVFRI